MNEVSPIMTKGQKCKAFLNGLMSTAFDEVTKWKPGPTDFLEHGIQGAAKTFGPMLQRKLSQMDDEDAVNICNMLSEVIMDNLVLLEEINQSE